MGICSALEPAPSGQLRNCYFCDYRVDFNLEPFNPFWPVRSVFTWTAGHSSLCHEEDGDRQEATSGNRSCLYSLMHTRLPDTCLDYLLGRWSDAPGSWTTVLDLNKYLKNVTSSFYKFKPSAGEIKLVEPSWYFSVCCHLSRMHPWSY